MMNRYKYINIRGEDMKRLFTILLVSILFIVLPLQESKVSAHEFDTHQYKDIPENSRYNQSLMILHRQGALEDKSHQTYYYPKRAMAREDVAAMIARSKNLALPKSVHSFRDVKVNDAKAKYIQAVSDAGIISGYPDGTFRPKETVTRGEMALFLQRAYNLQPSTHVKFKDVTVNGTSAAYAISALIAKNITSGYPDGTFRPNAPVERGEAAILMAKTVILFDEAWTHEGGHVVGRDIEPKEYIFKASEDGAQLTIFDYNTGKRLLGSTYKLHDQIYITLEKGQSVVNKGGRLHDSAGIRHDNNSKHHNGTYKVGYDVPVGPTTLIPRSSKGIYSINTSSDLLKNSAIETKEITRPTTVHLKKGQYISVYHVTIQ